MNKISEQDLFNMGWRRFGDEEDDPFYRFVSRTMVLHNQSLSGNFVDAGGFMIYGVPLRFIDAKALQKWIAAVGFEPDWEIINRSGSSEPVED